MTDADPKQEVDTLRSKLKPGDGESVYVQFDADRTHLLRMSDNIRLLPSEIGEFRHLKILRHCRRMAALAPPPTVGDFRENDELEEAGIETEADVEALLEDQGLLGAALEYQAAAEAVVRWIHNEYTNEHTNQDYRTCFRSFGRYRLKLEDPPESMAWIPTGTSNSFDPTPSERDLLDWEDDVVPLIDAAQNPRDAALFAVQFEAGLRGGELYDLRVDDVFDAEHTVGVIVDGKEGERTVHLITSVPYLQQWLQEHPGGGSTYLWSKLSKPERPSYATFLNFFKDSAVRAGVSKSVTPTNFRKSNTRHLVLLGFSQARIEDRQGRERGSEHTARYLARFGEESNEKAYAEVHGMDVESEAPPEQGPVECPRCHRETPRHEDHCVWCHFARSKEAAAAVSDQDDRVFDSALEAAPSDAAVGGEATVEDVREVRDLLNEHPALRRVFLGQ